MRLKGFSVFFMKQNGNIEDDGKEGVKLRLCEKATNFLQDQRLGFVLCSNGQIYRGDFAKFCGLLRIHEQ